MENFIDKIKAAFCEETGTKPEDATAMTISIFLQQKQNEKLDKIIELLSKPITDAKPK